jgi:hypothetical protein
MSEPHRVGPALIKPVLDQIWWKRCRGIDNDGFDFERARADPGEPDLGHGLGDGLLRDLLAGRPR